MLKNKIKLSVRFIEKIISVKGHITFVNPVNSFAFSLNKNMEKISGNFDDVLVSDIELAFRPPCKKYEILFNAGSNDISFSYVGPVSGWNSFIEEDRIAANFYSAWYPVVESKELDEVSIFLYGLEDYVVLNGEFNLIDKTWRCRKNPDDPYNILAFKKDNYLVYENNNAVAYYFDNSEKQAAIKSAEAVEDIIRYFNGGLFPKRDFNKYLLVSFSNFNENGGYIRGNLIVTGHFEKNEDSAVSFLAHEIAHEWCTGADFSFEDWLNETTAEWASLMYMHEVKQNSDYFNKKIEYHKEIANDSPPIKPADLKRPQKGVHSKGTVLFFGIYEKYGIEEIKKLLRIFVGLEEKTTDEFLRQIEAHNMDIAHYLAKGILIQ